MNLIQFVLADFIITGLLMSLIQFVFQERMERRLTRFSKLHERRAEVIARLYKLLVQVESNVTLSAIVLWPRVLEGIEEWSGLAASLEKDRQELKEQLATPGESIKTFWSYFERHQIYLPKSLVERIRLFYYQSLLADWNTQLIEFSQGKTDTPREWSDEEKSDQYREQLTRLINETIPSLKKDIEKEFRKLLGS